MSISLVSSFSTRIFSGTDLVLNHGFTLQEDDVVVFVGNSNANGVIIGFDGFTSELSTTYATSVLDIAYKVAGSSEPSSYTFTYDASDRRSGALLHLRGVDTSNVFDLPPLGANVFEDNNTTPLSASANVSTSDSFAVFATGVDSGGVANYSNVTNGFSLATSQVNGNGQALFTKSLSSQGAIGETQVSLNASRQWYALLFSLRAEGSSTGPSIDDIDGDNEVRAGQQSVVITGTNIENATSVTLGGEPLTIV